MDGAARSAEQVPGLLWAADADLRLTWASGARLRASGLAPQWARGVPVQELFGGAQATQAVLAHRRALAGETAEFDAAFDGRVFLARVGPLKGPDGAVVGAAGLAQELGGERRLETALLQRERLAAMGQTAAGLAHELNNPLVVILGYVELGLTQAKAGLGAEGALEVIKRQAARAHKLVQNLLAFSRVQRLAAQDFELREAVRSALTLLDTRPGPKSVQVECDLGEEPLHLQGHVEQLEQAVLNLASNALDAMPEGGTLTVRSRRATQSGRGVALLEVRDTGAGIPPELRERLLEPFFTTKAPGKGTGLGLWLVREIAAKHGGRLDFTSEEGRGTTFTLSLPLSS